MPITEDSNNNNSSLDSAIASGNVLVAPSTTRITVSELPAFRQAKGFRRTKYRGPIAARDAPKTSPYHPGRRLKDLSTFETPKWNAFTERQEPLPIQRQFINRSTAAPIMDQELTVTAQPYHAGPPKLEKINTIIRQDPLYTGPATEEEIDAVFAEDDLDMDFFVMGMGMKMDWDAKPKYISAYADLEAELSEGLNVTKKSILKKHSILKRPSTLKKPEDRKEDTRTSHSRSLA